MGPLIPQGIISGDLNFFFAFIIGIAFGFLLEQAGFSTSRKLVGVFYGYDFAVLKVFFTAGLTAALGIYYFGYMGWINMDLVYVNPLFTWAAVAGGAIMGLGFILGGYCPGTGFAAAVIGKVDALIFLAGIFLGVFLFGIYYDFLEPLYNGFAHGRIFVHEVLGLSQGTFVFLLVVAAIIAFVLAELMEEEGRFSELRNHARVNTAFPVFLLGTLVVLALLLPGQRISYWNETTQRELAEKMTEEGRHLDAIKVAHSIMRDIGDIHLVDVRSAEEYNRFHLPGAVSIPVDLLLDNRYTVYLQQRNKKTVFYSNGGVMAEQAWFIAERAGLGEFHVLQGGLNRFFELIFGDLPEGDEAVRLGTDNMRFLNYARSFFRDGEILRRVPGDARVPEIDTASFAPVEGGC